MRYQSKQALLTAIRTEHDAFCARVDAIPKARCGDPGVWGDSWSVRDLVAHLAEWQAMFLAWYDDGARGIAPSMPAPGYKWSETPRLNRAIWNKHRHRSMAAIRAGFDTGYRRILAIVEQLSEDELLRPGHFAWTGRYPLTTYLGANTASHYRFGSKVLKRWRKRKTGTATADSRPNTLSATAARRDASRARASRSR